MLIEKSGGGEKTPVGRAVLFDKEYVALFANFMDRIKIDKSLIRPEYAVYWLSAWYGCKCSPYYISQTTGIQNINLSLMLAKEHIFYPPLREQDGIVLYLDSKCGELDTLATDIQEQIDTLEQEKRSIISEAVTGKLMDNVEQADSGLNWAKQLPKHWHTIPSKYLFYNSDLRKFHDDEQLTASQKYGIITQKQYMENEQAQIVLATQGLDKWKHVEPNDFIISLRSFQGGLEMSEITGCITWHYVVLKAAKPIVPRFYKWLFKSSVYINALQGTCNFIRDGQDLRFSNFAQVPLFEPPLEEQEQIANFLDVNCGEIDAIIAKKKEQLSVLADYKKSLIYEYVTGKKEVPLAVSDMAVAFDPHIIMLGIVIDKLGKEIRGKIQLQKMLYLMDEHIGLNRSTQYYRYAHGPYDLELDHYVEILVSNHWYEQKHQGADLLVPGKNHADFVKTYHDAFSDHQKEIDKLITFLKPMKTSQVERIATLYAAWNDFMIDGNVAPTDSQIIHEVMTNWTNNKANTKYSTWQGTLDKMKKNGIIPKGLGLHTLPKM
ncbi:hypothetical protein [Lacrimispora sp. 210928-DFI.3.58]|uniref:hypothetical protein n=1 Tax=Lacrimispora sp. 210928-DFI.3.58 TaxID=2883214 RepID=UPI001D097F9A|nr:hypothetical protein [Lacrimispora sp. 210928-DFI.3.58]MCB7320879.1 hypothetical protein [Lacrimispora sp. 210928-DFI.3.58]